MVRFRAGLGKGAERSDRAGTLFAVRATLGEVLREVAVTLDSAARQQIALRVRRVLPQVRQLLLFGSQARGDARADSDVDLLLIVPDGEDRTAAAIAARRSLMGMGRGFDLLVLHEAEWRQLQDSPAFYHRQIRHDAVRVDTAA